MDVIVFSNGLGNQMSQYAFYLQKKSLNQSTCFILVCKEHNGFELNDIFNIKCKESILQKLLFIPYRLLLIKKLRIISQPIKFILRLLNFNIINENYNYSFNENYMLSSRGVTYYYGGWLSEKYFSSVKDQLPNHFEFRKINSYENTHYINNIKKNNSVSVHVRRGDYLDANNYELFGDVCNKSYFEKAISFIKTKVSEPHFFVFSNDIPWVKANLQFNNDVTYVIGNTNNNSWKDMYLMSMCKHNIIANSSFSWWGAWLNKNPKKIIISPNRFLKKDKFNDVYAESWIKLSDY